MFHVVSFRLVRLVIRIKYKSISLEKGKKLFLVLFIITISVEWILSKANLFPSFYDFFNGIIIYWYRIPTWYSFVRWVLFQNSWNINKKLENICSKKLLSFLHCLPAFQHWTIEQFKTRWLNQSIYTQIRVGWILSFVCMLKSTAWFHV